MNAITSLEKVGIPIEAIEKFCQRWHIVEMSLFGSILRDDFRADSDVDILVVFSPSFQRTLADMIQIKDELKSLFKRDVDIIVKSALKHSKNELRRQAIFESAQTIYVA
jgi:predicted nucleotidyltransferase